ncbi:tRNA (adenosine(37)-N6)-threonylcarbamoyltransferase complex transferase subunit TsaD [Mesoplasma entomophilum]|uniref:tRNA (adenosine(37)-N6)-threonylcarbamoyltransferase complex transferase subunit TsaD n=1 Tax=Mesoplasma entomophilum TaxID=2149 RepID=UPI000D02B81E|nr:tRNA (adenosine(37)-N6)-threonylcarbamoyltransferase complex transferase subunit TsaD [Mesoplasma entomophilum]AVN60492.1 tRNA (adenosine(37)-N6)-threonylcarbamoyltransferase complex transferase subunit TsaD [Mesoplasma entomophilum]
MKILAIESSCDEFSISIIDDGKILTNIISSQIEQHVNFGGVVPELAARLHLENISWVIKAALESSNTKIEEIDYVAYTEKPGLIGSLIIGKLVAETIASYIDKPLMPLHHIEGHIYGASIENEFIYPVLAMVVSGGHTQIEIINSPNDFKIIGATLDDAIGECYDKVARVMGLGYPGGPKIDKLAKEGNKDAFVFPIPKNDESYDFSYSGLKTAVINIIHNLTQKGETIPVADVAASFQYTATKIIEKKLEKAINEFKPKTLTVAGGVSANSEIRNIVLSLGEKYNLSNTFVPKMEYCTDNAAMIAKLAYEKLKISK